MISLLLPIARTTFLESLRQPIYFVLLMLSALGLLISTWTSGFSMGYTEQSEVSGDNKMLLEVGMATVFLVGTLIAGFVSTSAISREIENKTVLTIISKPVPRWVLIVGKFIGITLATTLAVITMVAFL
ncbi:MAG: ABC transporter permease, partial [Phycisphaerales bacterium]